MRAVPGRPVVEETLEETLVEPPPRRTPRTFEALRDRNFRWFFAALFGTFTAMNTQMLVRGWLVFELTGSYEALGLMQLVFGIVGIFLAPLGGVLADRVRQKKHVVQAAQAINSLTSLAIAALIAAGTLHFWHLVVAAFIQGAAMNVMMPSRQALTPEVVGMERLMNAIALSTSGMNVARLLMPGFAGWMLAALGGGNGNIAPAQYVYLLMAGLYAWAILGLARVGVPDRPRPDGGFGSPLQELRLGARYTLREPVIRILLACNFFMVFFGMTYFMLLPGFAKDVLQAGPGGLGVLISMSGVGALVGSLVVASLPSRRRGLLLLGSAGVLALGLIGFALSEVYWLAVACLVIVGLGQAGRMSLSNALIQHYVDDDYRGRVMSIYMLEFALMSVSIYPIGLLADTLGPQLAIGGCAVALLALVIVLLLWVPAYRDLE